MSHPDTEVTLPSLLDAVPQIEPVIRAHAADAERDRRLADPVADAMRAGAFAEFERAMIRSRVRAGLDRARARGVRLGRPTVDPKVDAAIGARLKAGGGVKKIAKAVGVGNGIVSRIKAAMAA